MISQKLQKSLQHKEVTKEAHRNLPIVTNNIDLVPHIANFFILRYLPERCIVFPEERAKAFMRHLVRWMMDRRFVNLDLTLIAEDASTVQKILNKKK